MLSKRFICLLILMVSSSTSWGMLVALRSNPNIRDVNPSAGPSVRKDIVLGSDLKFGLHKDSKMPLDKLFVQVGQPLFNTYGPKCEEIKAIAKKSQDEQLVYASYYSQTPQGQQGFLNAIERVQKGSATPLQVVKEMEEVTGFCSLVRNRENSLISDSKEKERIKQMVLPSSGLPALGKKEEELYVSLSPIQREQLKKLYRHFNGTGNTEINLSTPEWMIVQSLPEEVKESFRSRKKFYVAHRTPTEDEQLFHVIGSAGQGACIGAGLALPYVLMREFHKGAKAAIPSKEELYKQLENQGVKSFEAAAKDALYEAEEAKQLPFLAPEDEALNKMVQAGGKIITQNHGQFLDDFFKNVGKEIAIPMVSQGFQNLELSVLADPSVLTAAAIGGSIGAISGLKNMPCETKNISEM